MTKPCQFCTKTRAAVKSAAARVAVPVRKAGHKVVEAINRKRRESNG